MAALVEPLRYWLLDHPAISGFRWDPSRTRGSSLEFVFLTVSLYLSLTLLLHLHLHRPSLSPSIIRYLSVSHNIFLSLLSATMAAGCSLSSLLRSPSATWIFCFPRGTRAEGPVFFWSYVFYLSKIYEFFDTVLILISGGRRLTFLHVYHHAGVVVMCYVWISTAQSLIPVALVTNAVVHVVMYSYYLSCSLGWRWQARWKKAVTELQIWQFLFSFAVSGVFLWLHFTRGGCEGMKGWIFNAFFNASLLALFFDFHSKAYKKRGKEERKQE